MALPKLNDNPEYEVVIPSSKKTIKFRPFLVKEQKILMIAFESNDRKQMLNAMIKTLESCIEDNIDVKKLATFDVDYLFTQIRSKSVGETSDLVFKCQNCEKEIEHKLNLYEIQPPITEKINRIKINDSISIEMNYPSYSYFIDNNIDVEKNNNTENIMEFIIACMDSIITEDEQIKLKDESREEIVNFIESLNVDQFNNMAKFVNTLPQLRHEFEITCPHCNTVNKQRLEGLQSFF